MITEDSLLGISGAITAKQVDHLILTLSKAWEAVFEHPIGDLNDDLEVARRWFDPVAQGQRLRREISKLDPMPEDLIDPQSPLTLSLVQGKWLVTPEGRCVLDLLKSLPKDQTVHFVTAAQTAPYVRLLANLYRDWSRHRLNSVVELLEGTNKPLQIPAAGIVVALLVNRSTSQERAMIRFTSNPERSVVNSAFFAPVQVFANVLAPNRRRSEISAQLIHGWMLFEARRRIGTALVVNDASDDRDGSVWIKAESESYVIDTLARDLVRGHRTRVTVDLFARAFDSLVEELRRESKTLAGFGLAHERPRDTQRLRELFISQLTHYDKANT